MKSLVARLLLPLLPFTIHGQIETDRPDQTEASSIVPVNSLQIETGFVWESADRGDNKTFAGPSTLLRYSINKIIEFRVFNQYERHSFINSNYRMEGLSDVELGAKFQIFKSDSSRTEVAFLSHVIIPTAKAGLSNQHLGTASKLCVSHTLNDWLALGYNIGYAYLEKKHSAIYSIALGASIIDRIGCYVEPFGIFGESGYFESNFDGGITYLLKENLQLDASYGTGLNQRMHYFSLGFSWNFAEVF